MHACGALTDAVIASAVQASARVAVVPCCHDVARFDAGALTGWLEGSLAIDAVRVRDLEGRGWRVWAQHIPKEITPHHRLLMACPPNG